MTPKSVKAAIAARLRPSARDLAVRDWKLTALRHAPSSAPTVVFCAPLMGRHMANDWGVISAGVMQMVASLLTQTDPNWTLLLTSQDRPDGLPDDPRITFLPFDEAVDGMDKSPKVNHLMRALGGQMAGTDGYLHALDADDILHPDLVAHIRRDNNGHGYWHRLGGMLDADTGQIARCGPRSLRYPTSRPFVSQCGSSAAIYVDFRDPACRADELAMHFYTSGHRNFRRMTTALGLLIAPIPFPAALYVMNTGENMRQKRGLMHRKMTYLSQNALPADQRAAWTHAFGLKALSAAASAPANDPSRRG